MRKQTKLVAVLSAAALLAIGASMTSFAKGWTEENGEWVFLNSDGDRVTSEWKRSGENYYYLNEDGIMVTDSLIYDDNVDQYYYVNEYGVKVMNAWKSVPNDEGEQVGDETPDVLWYYFGSAGKAVKADDGTLKKVKEVNGKYYIFDEEGRMFSGWQEAEVNGKTELYYLGNENEGWAYTGWQKLEPDEKLTNGAYDELEWFYFGGNGKANRDKSKYINKRYYHFNEDGVMDDGWYDAATPPAAASGADAYASSNGTLGAGWVYTTARDAEDGDEYWYYLVTIREGNKVARSIPFNFGADVMRAKVIKNKTYIFDEAGKMLDGFVTITSTNIAAQDDNYHGVENRTLVPGLYYFNEAGGSVNGQMMTGRVAVDNDGDTFYYCFSKEKTTLGKAYTNAVKDGYLYGADGRCITADDGNSYMVYYIEDDEDHEVTVYTGSTPSTTKLKGIYVVVSRTGKIKVNGSVTIDGVKYTVSNYAATQVID